MISLNIEKYLQKIDLLLSEKSEKDIYMVYIMVFAGIFAFAYLLFWDASLSDFNKVLQRTTVIQTKTNIDNSYLNSNPEVKISKLNTQIKNIQTEIAVNKDKNSYIKNKIRTISSLLYNEKTWGAYINSISINAKKT